MIARSIDAGHARAVRSYQARSIEVFVAQASNEDGQRVAFSSVSVEADRQVQQLRACCTALARPRALRSPS